jgi:hypothetical protein
LMIELSPAAWLLSAPSPPAAGAAELAVVGASRPSESPCSEKVPPACDVAADDVAGAPKLSAGTAEAAAVVVPPMDDARDPPKSGCAGGALAGTLEPPKTGAAEAELEGAAAPAKMGLASGVPAAAPVVEPPNNGAGDGALEGAPAPPKSEPLVDTAGAADGVAEPTKSDLAAGVLAAAPELTVGGAAEDELAGRPKPAKVAMEEGVPAEVPKTGVANAELAGELGNKGLLGGTLAAAPNPPKAGLPAKEKLVDALTDENIEVVEEAALGALVSPKIGPAGAGCTAPTAGPRLEVRRTGAANPKLVSRDRGEGGTGAEAIFGGCAAGSAALRARGFFMNG